MLLLDEPTAALDVRHQEALLGVARACRAGPASAVVVVLHDLSLAAAYADRVCRAGRTAASPPTAGPGTCSTGELLSEVYDHPVEVVEMSGQLVVLPVRRRLTTGTEVPA